MSKFWIDYPEMMEELASVKSIMKDSVKSRERYFNGSISSMIDGGGKMLRPAFLLLGGKFGEYEAKKMQNLAAAVEMLHLATLIHDDIIDDSKLRRGCETIQSKYGKDFAVYIGDFLFCNCMMMLSEYEYTMENVKKISKAVSNICMGEIRQYHLRYATNVNVRNYLRVVSGKTAALFAISFFMGARESKCSEKMSKLLGKIGYHIGMAFQIIDDLLDYCGDVKRLGKSAQGDLKSGYYTLPLIFALEKDHDNEIGKILDRESLMDEDIDQISRLVEKYGGVEKAKKVAVRYTNKAFDDIEKLPDCDAKDILKEVVEKLLKRDY